MANHKRRKPKDARSGCLLCKMHKSNANKHSARAQAEREARRHERRAEGK